ncbi:Os02g0120200 [Oryza sativa Japonica Group]|uniref:Os02g0120200 protein n=2 Tax=Oryza sativa subsp. japonica TaxID=39947 RepID=Q6ZHA7_ORYSJ|nr:hypothetical protein EE612_008512 [Oryza sativa]BAD07592.1 phospholipase D delta isoform 1b-like protein [Oryza sativa Japonica Group]BAD08132.1 phospholipase D delta isoform 1b-like protein [Oryza sativa Japonica Group]BAH91506.1 Os02g0120200 [Oryza sativa Japonica Group]BAS76699.1 Os02g0120200 [Oryza sativa Japonica Group]|eukprot:NP_001172777.1 Os02g0120200 [Oryza sativa Japonica Group]
MVSLASPRSGRAPVIMSWSGELSPPAAASGTRLLHGDLDLTIHEARGLPNMDFLSTLLRRLCLCLRPPARRPSPGQSRGSVPADEDGRRQPHGHHLLPTSDPYAAVVVAGNTLARTHVVRDSEDPEWSTHVLLHLAHHATGVAFHVKDADPFGSDLIGVAILPAADVLAAAAAPIVRRELPLYRPDGRGRPKPSSAIVITASFVPAGEHQSIYDAEHGGVPAAYFPARRGCEVKLYQDAHVAGGELDGVRRRGVFEPGRCWEDMCLAVLGAQHLVYVAGWSVNTKVRLVREAMSPEMAAKVEEVRTTATDDDDNPVAAEGMSLGALLKYKSQEGVRVCLLVWDDKTSHDTFFLKTGGLMQTHDEETKKFFKDSSVICLLSPRYPSSKLSMAKQKRADCGDDVHAAPEVPAGGHAGVGEHAADHGVPRRPRPRRGALRHAVAQALRRPRHRLLRRRLQPRDPAGGEQGRRRRGGAAAAVARHALPRRRAGGVRRAGELRAAVEEGDEAVQKGQGALEGRRLAQARAHLLDPQPLRLRRRRRRRRRQPPLRLARWSPRLLERSGVPVSGLWISERIASLLGDKKDGGEAPGVRQERDGGAEHSHGVRPGDPVGEALHLHREPVLHRIILRMAILQAPRRCWKSGADGDRAEGGEQDRRRREVRRVHRDPDVAGGGSNLGPHPGDPLLAEADDAGDVRGDRGGDQGGGDGGRGAPAGLPQLLLPRQAGGGGGGGGGLAGAGAQPGGQQRAAAPAVHDLRALQGDDRGRRVRHRRLRQHQPALSRRLARHRDRRRRLPAQSPRRRRRRRRPGVRLQDVAVGGAPGQQRVAGAEVAGVAGVREAGERDSGGELEEVRRRRRRCRHAGAPHEVPGGRRRRRQDQRVARARVLPRRRREDPWLHQQQLLGLSHHVGM